MVNIDNNFFIDINQSRRFDSETKRLNEAKFCVKKLKSSIVLELHIVFINWTL